MTLTKANKRRDVQFGLQQGRLTFEQVFLRALTTDREADSQVIWPNPIYQNDIVGFFENVLGVEPWEKQREVLAEVQKGTPFIQVPSGHKTGKSCLAVGIALWNCCSFEDSRTVLTSTTDRQVNTILWREFKMRKQRAGRCVKCRLADPYAKELCPHSIVIPGSPADVARSGFRLPGTFNEVFGFTAREAEGVAGLSGPRQVFIVDEASGVDDKIFEALEGNMAGGNCILLSFSNPTRDYGWFYNSCEKNKVGVTVQISSEETPNATSGKLLIPGLATAEYIETMRKRWGADSEWYRVRVLGKFSQLASDVPFSVALLTEAHMRWTPEPRTTDERLTIGVDVAGDGLKSDDFVVCPRRGLWCGEMREGFKGDSNAQAEYVVEIAKEFRRGDERVTICFDAEGMVGWEFHQAILRVRDKLQWLDLKPVKSSKYAVRRPQLIKRVSGELVDNGLRFLKAGGALPENMKLDEELHAWRFFLEEERGKTGVLIYVDKNEVKERIGRSPDRSDAFFLATWTWDAEGVEDTADQGAVVEHPSPQLEPHERTAALGAIPALGPDWGRNRPAEQGGFEDVGPVRPLSPWG